MAFSVFSICFADAIASAGEMNPNLLFRPNIRFSQRPGEIAHILLFRTEFWSDSLTLGLLIMACPIPNLSRRPVHILKNVRGL